MFFCKFLIFTPFDLKDSSPVLHWIPQFFVATVVPSTVLRWNTATEAISNQKCFVFRTCDKKGFFPIFAENLPGSKAPFVFFLKNKTSGEASAPMGFLKTAWLGNSVDGPGRHTLHHHHVGREPSRDPRVSSDRLTTGGVFCEKIFLRGSWKFSITFL